MFEMLLFSYLYFSLYLLIYSYSYIIVSSIYAI